MEAYTTPQSLSEEMIQKTIDFVIKNMKNKDTLRRFDGGVNLFVQGIPRLPNDIDIRTDKHGYQKFKQIFADFKKKEGYNKKRGKTGSKYYMILDIQGVIVEIAYYEKENKNMDMFGESREINWNGLIMPVLGLVQMKYFYKWFGSKKKVELIDTVLKKKNI